MKELDIKYSPTRGSFSCMFTHDGKEYYADLSWFVDGSECMIFKVVDGKVVYDDIGEYCERDVPMTEDGLRACIEEFIASL